MQSELNVSPSFPIWDVRLMRGGKCDSRGWRVIPTAVIFELWNKAFFFLSSFYSPSNAWAVSSCPFAEDYPENMRSLQPYLWAHRDEVQRPSPCIVFNYGLKSLNFDYLKGLRRYGKDISLWEIKPFHLSKCIQHFYPSIYVSIIYI